MEKLLENGLVIRSMSDAYREALPQFYVDVFTDAYGPEDAMLKHWAKDLVSPHHPTVTDEDVWMAIDENNTLQSALLLIPQVWHYEDVSFPVGRVELVATRKNQRHQSLTRTLMNVAHERSADLGHLVQVITGIPYFYRKFGYTMAVKLGAGSFLPFAGVAELKDGQLPQFTLRAATLEDIPALRQWHSAYCQQVLLSVERLEQQWQHELTTRPMGTVPSVHYFVIQTQAGEGVGYLCIRDMVFDNDLEILEYVVGDTTSYLETFDDVTRAAQTYAAATYPDKKIVGLTFDNGIHPSVHLMVRKSPYGSDNRVNYSWYIRVAQPARFIQQIAPVLERRLHHSGAHRYTGELKINFFDKTGLVMRFEQGKLSSAEDRRLDFREENAGFPFHSFLNLVFGYQSIDDLKKTLPDSFARRDAHVLLDILFPVKPSWVMGQL